MSVPETILIIDDESQIRKLLRIALAGNEYRIEEASTGREGIRAAATYNPGLIILDLGLPDMDGHAVLKEIRSWYNKPVIILSVRNAEDDIVQALDSGANDYLTKPFRTRELLARIRSAVRQSQGLQDSPVLTSGDLSIDLSNHCVRKNDHPVRLTSTEYTLLTLLARNEGRVLTHQMILKEVWGPGYIDQTQYLRVFIAQLRKKVEDDPSVPKRIITEPGIGYRYEGQDNNEY